MTDSLQKVPEQSLQPRTKEDIETLEEAARLSTELICGVDKALIETFLRLIQENYKKADEATFFLEQRTGVSNVQGIANVRDVLSHLVTLLNPDTPDDKRKEQISNAEEHLRRAIIEPYETALNELTIKFAELYQNHKQFVEPIKDEQMLLRGAPNAVSIEASLRAIQALTSIGRAAKAKNIWDPSWEEGVTHFIDAYDKLSALYVQIEGYWNKYEQLNREAGQKNQIDELQKRVESQALDLEIQSKRSNRLARVGIVATITTFILAIIVALLLAGYNPLSPSKPFPASGPVPESSTPQQ